MKNRIITGPHAMSNFQNNAVKRVFRPNSKLSPNIKAMAKANPERILQVMSYNVLADRFATDGNTKFHHTTEKVLNFDYRGPRILDEIKHSDAPIVCL